MNNIKSGDIIFFNGISSTIRDVFITDTTTVLTIYNKYDGEIDVTPQEITLTP